MATSMMIMQSVFFHLRAVAHTSAAESERIVDSTAVKTPTNTLLRRLSPYWRRTVPNIAKLTPPSAPRRLRSAMHAMGQRMNSSTLPSRTNKISLSAAFSHRGKRTSRDALFSVFFWIAPADFIYSAAALSPIRGSKRSRISVCWEPNRDRSSAMRSVGS